MKRRTRYTQGQAVDPTEFMCWVRQRCEWAAKESGVKSAAIRRVRWEWANGIWCQDRGEPRCELYGRVKYGKGGFPVVVVSVSDDGHWQDTASHEYAHALLEPLEGLRQRGPEDVDEASHTPMWAALYGSIYQLFVDMGRSGPQEGAGD